MQKMWRKKTGEKKLGASLAKVRPKHLQDLQPFFEPRSSHQAASVVASKSGRGLTTGVTKKPRRPRSLDLSLMFSFVLELLVGLWSMNLLAGRAAFFVSLVIEQQKCQAPECFCHLLGPAAYLLQLARSQAAMLQLSFNWDTLLLPQDTWYATKKTEREIYQDIPIAIWFVPKMCWYVPKHMVDALMTLHETEVESLLQLSVAQLEVQLSRSNLGTSGPWYPMVAQNEKFSTWSTRMNGDDLTIDLSGRCSAGSPKSCQAGAKSLEFGIPKQQEQ